MATDDGTAVTRQPTPRGSAAITPGERRCYLLHFEGEHASLVPLPWSGSVVIGRGSDVQVRLQDGSASRRHARLTTRRGVALLEDLGSSNGTLVNGAALGPPLQLRSGDTIGIGAASLVFHSSASVAGSAGAAAALGEAPQELELPGGQSVLIADPAMDRVYALLRRLAQSDLTVLIHGETGVGKENAALAVHHFSRRRERPFVPINCAALPENLAESELFGHERGAFSGAVAQKVGLLESASGGTVFLDEVGELPLAIQAKLLRVLEERRLTRVGEVRPRDVDLRVVAATHRDLEEESRAGRFRQDLYFRLSAATVMLPPLRDRPREITLLAQLFQRRACARLQRPVPALSAALLTHLRGYAWPGNVRELRNLMEYLAAAVEGDEVVELCHLPVRLQSLAPAPRPTDPGGRRAVSEELRELERARMAEALLAEGGVRKRAAERINMPLRTFIMKMKQYGLS